MNINTQANTKPAPLVYSMNDAIHLTSLSRSYLNELIRDGSLSSVKVGARRLIHAEALHDLVKPRVRQFDA